MKSNKNFLVVCEECNIEKLYVKKSDAIKFMHRHNEKCPYNGSGASVFGRCWGNLFVPDKKHKLVMKEIA